MSSSSIKEWVETTIASMQKEVYAKNCIIDKSSSILAILQAIENQEMEDVPESILREIKTSITGCNLQHLNELYYYLLGFTDH